VDDGRLASNLEDYFPRYLGLRAEFGAPEGFTAPETRANHLKFSPSLQIDILHTMAYIDCLTRS